MPMPMKQATKMERSRKQNDRKLSKHKQYMRILRVFYIRPSRKRMVFFGVK